MSRDIRWTFTPGDFKEGQPITGGDVIGIVYENEIIDSHKILCPPNVYGVVSKINTAGTDGQETFLVDDIVMEVYNEAQDRTHKLSLSHFWPVRRPRPITEKLPGNVPLITGLRVIDGLFPSVLGGTCAVPGAFGCGKTGRYQLRLLLVCTLNRKWLTISLSRFFQLSVNPCQSFPTLTVLFMLDAVNVETRWLKYFVISQNLP